MIAEYRARIVAIAYGGSVATATGPQPVLAPVADLADVRTMDGRN